MESTYHMLPFYFVFTIMLYERNPNLYFIDEEIGAGRLSSLHSTISNPHSFNSKALVLCAIMCYHLIELCTPYTISLSSSSEL